ncbi:reverse transcriptase domain-containing protein [Tanacetum coccineum]
MEAELEEEEMLAREREEDANIAEWDNTQAIMDADYELAARIQAQDFDEVQKAFDKTMSWIDSFVPMDSEVVEGSKDRAEGSETRAEGSSEMPTDPHHTPTIIQPSKSQPLLKQRSRNLKRKDTEVPQPSGPTDNVADEAVVVVLSPSKTMVDTICTTGVRDVSKTSNDHLHRREVLDLENTKTAQAQEITSLKLRVKKLEKKGGSRTHKLKRLYKVGRSARVISSDEASLGDQGRYGDEEMFDTGVLDGDEVLAEPEVTIKDVNLSVDEVTLAQALAALKSAKVQEKANVVEEPSESITTTPTLTTTTAATTITAVSTRPRAKGLVIHEEEQATTPTVSSQQPSQVKAQDKGKGIMVEEPMKMKKKDQISLDEELAFKLQDEEEEERLAREKAPKKKKLTLSQESDVIKEKSKLFVQLLEARKKHFAAMRAQEERNKPPTKAQKRNTMSTYLKNMAGYKYNQLKNKSFDDIQKLFDKAIKRVNTFIDMDTNLVKGSEVRAEGSETRVEGSSKRAGEKLEQENSKKQKLEDDKETTELQRLIEVVSDKEEVEIDAIPLATKPPSIVDYKILKEGKKTYYQIIRADGSSKMYLVFSHMIKSFDREDLETLWKLVKAKHGSTRPEEGYERVLGRIVGIKRLHDDLGVTAAKIKKLSSSRSLKLQVRPLPEAFADIKGIDSSFCTHKILIEEEYKPTAQPQRHTVFREPPYPFDYPMRRLTMEEILAKFIDEGRREHEKQHEDGVENKSLSISEKAAHPLVKPQQPSIPFPKRSLLTNKSRLEEACTETMNERCSAILLNELPLKEKDPTSFIIPCQVLEKHKEAEDLAVDHSSRLENPQMEVLTEREIADKFSDKHLMTLKSKSNNDEPMDQDFVNYIIGMLFYGTISQSRGNKYILVAVDYVSKWVEAQALPTNDARVVVKFLRSLFARFGVPKALIRGAGAISTQSNGQTEVTNRAIKRILERSVGYGYCKNLKKTVKTGQTRTREQKSTQRAERMLSKVNNGQH